RDRMQMKEARCERAQCCENNCEGHPGDECQTRRSGQQSTELVFVPSGDGCAPCNYRLHRAGWHGENEDDGEQRAERAVLLRPEQMRHHKMEDVTGDVGCGHADEKNRAIARESGWLG